MSVGTLRTKELGIILLLVNQHFYCKTVISNQILLICLPQLVLDKRLRTARPICVPYSSKKISLVEMTNYQINILVLIQTVDETFGCEYSWVRKFVRFVPVPVKILTELKKVQSQYSQTCEHRPKFVATS